MALEFDLIERYFFPLSQGFDSVEIGIGDDGAVLNVPEQHQLVVVTDTLVAGVHFPVKTLAYDIAWKALAVNLSDLAAMGATPACYSLALTLPSYDARWLQDFSRGLRDLSTQFKIPLVGGDTTKGPLTITITAQGWVPNQQAVLRSGAQEGDFICVTNTLGEGALGLKLALAADKERVLPFLSKQEQECALNALNRPMPQLAISLDLRGLANSAIDISDGLLADLAHMLKHSSKAFLKPERGGKDLNSSSSTAVLGAEIELTQLPLSSGVLRYIEQTNDWTLPLSGGDDYQLCVTVSPKNRAKLMERLSAKGVSLSVIGKVVMNDLGIRCLKQGVVHNIGGGEKGYRHF